MLGLLLGEREAALDGDVDGTELPTKGGSLGDKLGPELGSPDALMLGVTLVAGDGHSDGGNDGTILVEGDKLPNPLGLTLFSKVGERLGLSVGIEDGKILSDGNALGTELGDELGAAAGKMLGFSLGLPDGPIDIEVEGLMLGSMEA